MANTALNRSEVLLLTNKSGGSVAQGDVVIIDSTTAASFTTTTTGAYVAGKIGVVLEPNGIASDAIGLIAFSGYVPKVTLSGAASLGDLFKTHTVAKQAVRHAAPAVTGDFGEVLGTGTSPAAILWGLPVGAAGAGTIGGSTGATDNAVIRADGVGGATIQNSLMTVDDSGTANIPTGQTYNINNSPHTHAGGATTVVAGAVERNNSGSYTTTSTTFADIDATNLKVTLTTGAHRVLVGFTGVVQNSQSTEFGDFDIDLDGSRMGAGALGIIANTMAIVDRHPLSFTILSNVLTAASHTFKIQWKSSNVSNTVSLLSNSTGWEPRLWVLETLAES